MHSNFLRSSAIALAALACTPLTTPLHAQEVGRPTASNLAEIRLPTIACPGPALAPTLDEVPDRSGAPLDIRADRFEAQVGTLGQAIGRVELFRADQYLSTEAITYRLDTGDVIVPNPVVYQDSQLELSASSGQFNLIEESGAFNDISYSLVGSSAQGGAERISLTGMRESELYDLWFTTCPGDDPEWVLSAKELELRHDEGVGVARGAKLKLGKVPVLYLPWMTFPIDDRRKSGFLYPSLGTANDNGLEFSIPYYWNIAPQQDATLEPRWFSERGFMLSGEYRFLTRRSYSTVDFDAMPSDRKADDSRYRYLARWNMSINRRWQAGARIERVSDNAFFQDFGGGLSQTSRQFLRSDASISGGGRYWIFTAMADDFQVIDDSVGQDQEPYSRLPRFTFLLDSPLGRSGLSAMLDSEAVYFHRDRGVTGARVDLYPQVAWNARPRWGFFEANAGYRYTAYELDLNGELRDSSPDRGTPILSLDSGVYFERTTNSGDTQTLEPRLFYLYVPFEEQDDLPDFDTGELTFGYAQLFHTNRFTGADRQTDANQLTIAASTRTYNSETGRESWSFNFGQILFFDPPAVTLDDSMPLNDDTSPFIAEFNWHPLDRTSARLGVEWSWEQKQLNVGVASLSHRTLNGSVFRFRYRFRRDRLDQFDVRYLWPVNENWRLFSRVNYSLEDSELLEGLIGVEYESCCWALRVSGRRYLRDRQGEYRDALYVELRLKGLGAFGRREPGMFNTAVVQ